MCREDFQTQRISREGLEENLEFALIVAPDSRGVKNRVRLALSSCHLSLLFKVLLFKIKKPRRFKKLTLETERTFIFRIRERSRIGWCQECAAEVELMSVVDAANETGLSELAIYQLIKSGDLHFIEDADRHIVACLSSLRCIQRKLDRGKDPYEQNSGGRDS